MITQERLREVLDYNPDSGVFRWLTNTGKRRAVGEVAGGINEMGYIVIMVDGVSYKAHRLAILYADGYLPENEVDHIDRVPWHNWRSNLREASRQCQSRNCKMFKNNSSGIKGCMWSDARGRWKAQITVDGKYRHLGYHFTILDAAYARYAAEQCLGFQDCDLNSSARKYIKAHGGVA